MSDLDERRLQLEQDRAQREHDLAMERLALERRQAGRFSGGTVTIIGALIAVASAVATSVIGGVFGLQTTSENNDAQFALQQEDVRGQLRIKELEVEGQIKVQTLAAQAERDRLQIQQKFEIIVQATKGLPPETASENLQFFVEAGILDDPGGKILGLAREGKAPDLPAPQPASSQQAENPLIERLAALDKSGGPAAGGPAFRIENGIVLAEGSAEVTHLEAQSFSSTVIDPSYVVMHYTGGVGESLVRYFTSKGRRASAHLLVRRDGSVVQLLPLDLRSWHAGSSKWGSLTGLNSHAVSVELENWGLLQRTGDSWTHISGTRLSADEIVEATHKSGGDSVGWHRFTEAQIATATALVKSLVRNDPDLLDVIGHDDISPGRKLDPGPAFPMEDLREAVFGRREALPPPS